MKKIFTYCPQCQSNNVKFTNNHRFECYSCNFVYYHNVASAVTVIIIKDGKILFTVRNIDPAAGKLDLPGGFVDYNENAKEAATRELAEELGIDVIADDLIYFTTEPNEYLYKDVLYRTLDIAFVLDLKSEIGTIQQDEIVEIRWLSKTEIDFTAVGFVSTQKILQSYLAKK